MFTLDHERKMGKRELRITVADAVNELMDADKSVLFLESDLAGASGSGKIQKAHTEQYIQVGIAEANMMGMAAGLSAVGFKPYTHTFGPFATRRVFDQVFL